MTATLADGGRERASFGANGASARVPATRLTFAHKIGLLLLLPFVGSLASVLFFSAYLQRTHSFAQALEVAAREPVQVEEIRAWAHMVTMGQREDRAGLQRHVARFGDALVALRHGGRVQDRDEPIDPLSPELQPALAAMGTLWSRLRPDLLALADGQNGAAAFVGVSQRADLGLRQLLALANDLVGDIVRQHERHRRTMLLALQSVVALALAVLFVGVVLTRRFVVRPIARFKTATARIHDGDFSARVEVSGHDELGLLASAFNSMVEEIERLLGEIRLRAAAMNAAADAILITDAHGAIVWTNPAFTGLSGFTAAEVTGRNLRDVVTSATPASASPTVRWETLRPGDVWRDAVTTRHKDGGLYTVQQSITPVLSPSGVIAHCVAIEHDISEARRLQAQLVHAQKLESVGRLAGGVAHDFNNLLTVILGWTERVLRALPADHANRGSLEEVLKAGERAARLTRQLLAFSRRSTVELAVFNANDLVAEMEKMFRRVVGEDIEIDVTADPQLGAVHMDRGQLEQVLMNLVVNARDAMPGGGRLRIATARAVLGGDAPPKDADVLPGDYVMITVRDSGMGMSDDVKGHLFEPFFTTKAPGKGTGLGLATSYGIVKQAGGFIDVESEPGVGTTIRIYLPHVHETASAIAHGSRPTPARGGETILLVEDEAAVRGVIVAMLETHGYRVVTASGGEEALRVLGETREPLHLVVTDVVLGGTMNGAELGARAPVETGYPGVVRLRLRERRRGPPRAARAERRVPTETVHGGVVEREGQAGT